MDRRLSLPRLSPIMLKERMSVAYVERGLIDRQDGAFVVVDERGVRTQIPVGGVACVMLEPGTRISHAAVELAARAGCLLLWVGESGVRLYAAGQTGGARADRLLYQCRLALDPEARLKVVRAMFKFRFGEDPPAKRSVLQLQAIEGGRIRRMYKELAARYGVPWEGRCYDAMDWGKADLPNRCLSCATAALYGVTEAAILIAGYSTAVGFLHTGKPQSFVYDVADLFKMRTVVPLAFEIAARSPPDPERVVRTACRDLFRRERLLEMIIPTIEEVLSAGGLAKPEPYEDAVPPPDFSAFSSGEGDKDGDDGDSA